MGSRIRYWVTFFSTLKISSFSVSKPLSDCQQVYSWLVSCRALALASRISVFNSRLKPFLFSVVFKNQKCLDCGLTGDVRLMSNYCHMEKVFVHPGSLIQYHPKRTERYHDSTTVIREHPGGLYRPWYSLDFFICKMGGER